MARLPLRVGLALLVALAVGVGLWWHQASPDASGAPASRATAPDEAGALVGAPTLQGSPRAQVERGAPRSEAPTPETFAEPEESWASLRIDVVDALSGRDVTASWNVGTGEVVAGPFAPGQVIDDAAIERSRQGVEEAIQRWQAAFRPSGSVRPDSVLHAEGGHVTAFSTVRPAPGFVLLRADANRRADRVRLEGKIAHGVRSLTAVVPVIREAVLDVRVLGPDGEPARRVVFEHLLAAGSSRAFPLEDRGPGVLRVRGIPFLPGEPVEGRIDWSEGAGPPPEPLESEDPPHNLHATVPENLAEPWIAEVRLTTATRAPYDHNEIDFDVQETACETSCTTSAQPCGRLRLKALGWDGQPLRGASLLGQTADAQGTLVVESLPAGPHTLALDVPGRLPIRLDATLRAGEETQAEVREPIGARLEIEVVDGDGRPRPTAQLQIEGARYFDVEGTTQRLDLFTDHLGRRSIARVEPGEATLHASWGSRTGSEKVTLQDGVTTRVRIVAR